MEDGKTGRVYVVKYTILPNGTSRMDKIPKPEELSFNNYKWKNFPEFKALFPDNKIPIEMLLALNTEGENILQYCARMKEEEPVKYLLDVLSQLEGDERTFVDSIFINNQATDGRRDTVFTNIALYCPEQLSPFLEKFKPDPSMTNQGGDITLNLIEDEFKETAFDPENDTISKLTKDNFEVYKKTFQYTKEQKPEAIQLTNTRERTCLLVAANNKSTKYIQFLLEQPEIKQKLALAMAMIIPYYSL